jgi:hypothetical protein
MPIVGKEACGVTGGMGCIVRERPNACGERSTLAVDAQ